MPSTYTFEWQAGYVAFSVSESQAGRVRDYVRSQIAHHRIRTFKRNTLHYFGNIRSSSTSVMFLMKNT